MRSRPPEYLNTHSRRTLIKAAGMTLALPMLETFGGPQADPNAQPPTRFVTLYFPNGVYPEAWQSQMAPRGLELAGSLSPLSEFAKQAVVLTGLDHPLSGHLGQISGFLSGCDLRLNGNGQIEGGVSLDQLIARKIGIDTYLPSLHLGMEPPSQGAFGDRPRSYGNSISWASPTSKIEPQINPQLAFDQVFHGQTPAGRKAASRQKRLLDHVWEEAKSLQSQVSSLDHLKLEQYYDSIRDVETKLEKAIHPPEKSWTPSDIPTLDRPPQAGIPASHPEHMRLLMDILLLALQTDSTRVATFVLGHSISRVVFDFADSKIRANHHDLSHHRNDPAKIEQYNIVTTWFAKQASYFLERMRSIPEGDGSMLDHSLVLFGSGMKDGNTHEPLNIPAALFGGCSGRIRCNQQIACLEGSVLANLHFTLLHAFGIEAASFNQKADKRIEGLLT